MKTNKIILLIGREHLEKDSYLYTDILSEIKGIQFDVFNDSYSYFRRRVYPYIGKVIPRFIRKQPIIRSLYLQIEEQIYSIILNPKDYKMHVAFQKNIINKNNLFFMCILYFAQYDISFCRYLTSNTSLPEYFTHRYW